MSIEYYYDLRNLKNFFIDHCSGLKKYEALKIWSRWLINHLCHIPINYHIIPNSNFSSSIDNGTEIISSLCEKGLDETMSKQFYEQLIIRIKALYQKYHQQKLEQLTHMEQMIRMDRLIIHTVTMRGSKRWHLYRINDIYIKYNQRVHDRLLSRYQGSNYCLKFSMFEMGFNYYILDGHSFQWCLPPKAMSILNHQLSVHTELFASPINAYLPVYHSLFKIDQ